MKNMYFNGRITRDAVLETRKVGGADTAVVNFNVAVNTRTGKKDEAGKTVVKTDYIRVTLWREYAKAMASCLKQGRMISVSGDFDLETWMDRSNQVHPVAHLTNPAIELLDKKPGEPEEPAETTPDAQPEELPFE